MTRRLRQGATALLLVLVPAAASAQGRVASASTETRRVTQSLEREIAALIGRKTTLWAAYRLQSAAASRQMCGGSHVVLESATEVTLMARLENAAVTRLRVFTPECDVDAGTIPIVWLDGVSADDSATWLSSLIRAKDKETDREWRMRVADPALTALSLQAGDGAVRSLITLAREDARTDVRSRALSSLAQRAGQQASSTIATAVERDPEIEVKRAAVQALSRLPKDEGVPLLIDVARTNRNSDVRREAMLRLGQSNDPRAVRFFEEILRR